MQNRKRVNALPAETRAFRKQALAFCRLIENHPRYPIRKFLRTVHQALAALYATALLLPEVSPEDKTSSDSDSAFTFQKQRRLCRSLKRRLGTRTHYYEVFNNYDRQDHNSLIGDLADDLSDIYAELTEGLEYWQSGHPTHAIFYWRFHLQVHWGEHATSAMRALHWLQFNDPEYGPVPPLPAIPPKKRKAARTS